MMQDLRYGVRMLGKHAGVTTIMVLMLALGSGATTAIFSVVNAVLLRPLPYEQPERLVALHTALPSLGYPRVGLSEAEFIALRQENRSFSELAGWNMDRATLRGVSEPERVIAPLVTANFFRTLGVNVALGRDFTAEDERAGRNSATVLSHAFWQRKFAGDPAVIGRSLTVDGSNCVVIGVLPASFKAPMELQADTHIDLWVPFDLRPANPRRGNQFLNVIGRLRAGATLAEAQAEHQANTRREANAYPQFYPADIFGFALPLERAVAGDAGLALWVLLGAVAVVLLIACVNVANLLLVRGEERRKELAVRAALGASRARLIRQLLIESVLLTALGAGLGLLLARFGTKALLAVSPANVPRLAEAALDGRVLGFALLVSALTAALFSLVPAWRAVQFDLQGTLKEGGRSAGQSGRNRLRQSLVAVEMALALVLLVAAGLLMRSFWNLQRVELGFRPDHLLTLRLTPNGAAYPDNPRIAGLYERLLARLNVLPGVETAAVTSHLPLNSGGNDTIVEIEGRPLDMQRLNEMSIDFRTVSPGFFRTMEMRLLRGRLLSDADQEGALPVVVINERFARAHWPHEDPLGKRFRYLNAPPERATTRFLTIVGVVANARNRALAQTAWPEAFVPLAQHAASYGGGGEGLQQAFSLVVRTVDAPVNLAAAVQHEARAVAPDAILSQVRAMDEVLTDTVARPRFNLLLLGSFALLALGLAAVGIYGVMSYTVAQRTHEIGVRMALGAQTRDVLKLVLKQGMTLTVMGLVAGLAGALAVTRLLATLLYDVSATDPLTFLAIASLLLAVAGLACWLPARRAAKVDPLVALRQD